MSDLQKQIDEIIAESLRIEAEIDSKLERLESMTFYRLDFYADNYQYKNKRFSFKCSSEQKAFQLLGYYLDNGNKVRACYINKFDHLYGKSIIVNSYRVNIDDFIQEYFKGLTT